MKRIKHIVLVKVIVIVLVFFVSSVIKAQSTDSTDVKYLVQKQIEEAKKKNSDDLDINYETPVLKTHAKKVVMETNLITGIPDGYFYKGIVMLIGAVAVFSWVGMRKVKRNKIFKNNRFKKNIKLMREEKFIKEIDPKLKEIRTKLTLTSVVLNEDKKISAAARISKIGKEEIILASRIRSHELQYGRQRSLA